MKVPGFSDTLLSGMADFQQLEDAKALQVRFWFVGLIGSFDNAYYEYRMGLLDEERWQTQRSGVASIFGIPGRVQLWEATPFNVSPEFVALVEEILAEEPGRGE